MGWVGQQEPCRCAVGRSQGRQELGKRSAGLHRRFSPPRGTHVHVERPRAPPQLHVVHADEQEEDDGCKGEALQAEGGGGASRGSGAPLPGRLAPARQPLDGHALPAKRCLLGEGGGKALG